MRIRYRIALGLVAVILLVLTGVQAVGRARAGRELDALLLSTGLARRQPDLVEETRREPDPVRARLLVARALVAEAVDQSSFNTLPLREAVEEAAKVGERLQLAETIAASALVARPAAWQGFMLVGAARYLAWSRSGDPRLLKERSSWEQPLQEAIRRAPEEEEPLELLALTRLELWPILSATERFQAREVLRRAFASETAYRRLIRVWFAVAASREEAWSLVPARVEAWQVVVDMLAASSEWEGWILARQKQDEIVLAQCREALDEGRQRLEGGDAAGARAALLRVVGAAPRDRVGAGLVAQAMELMPPGGAAGGAWSVFAPWVRWSADHLLRGLVGLPPAAIARMLAAQEPMTPPDDALTSLAAGELAPAETLERRAEDLNRENWAPYFVAKARMLARRGDARGALAALSRIHRNWAKLLVTARARLEVAERTGDEAQRVEAGQDLAALTATRWPATAWLWRGSEATLEIETSSVCDGVLIAVDEAPKAGGVVAVALDDVPAMFLLARAAQPIRLAGPIAAGYHAIVMTPAAGGRVLPGEVSLELASQ
jgi:hypothetical protein